MDEEKNGDVFTAINVIGTFFIRIYKTLKEGMTKKVERIINEESKVMNLNLNTMR